MTCRILLFYFPVTKSSSPTVHNRMISSGYLIGYWLEVHSNTSPFLSLQLKVFMNISYEHFQHKLFRQYLWLSHAGLISTLSPCWTVEEYLPIIGTLPDACVWLLAHAISLLKERGCFSHKGNEQSLWSIITGVQWNYAERENWLVFVFQWKIFLPYSASSNL